jgi:hypothetical protein
MPASLGYPLTKVSLQKLDAVNALLIWLDRTFVNASHMRSVGRGSPSGTASFRKHTWVIGSCFLVRTRCARGGENVLGSCAFLKHPPGYPRRFFRLSV